MNLSHHRLENTYNQIDDIDSESEGIEGMRYNYGIMRLISQYVKLDDVTTPYWIPKKLFAMIRAAEATQEVECPTV